MSDRKPVGEVVDEVHEHAMNSLWAHILDDEVKTLADRFFKLDPLTEEARLAYASLVALTSQVAVRLGVSLLFVLEARRRAGMKTEGVVETMFGIVTKAIEEGRGQGPGRPK